MCSEMVLSHEVSPWHNCAIDQPHEDNGDNSTSGTILIRGHIWILLNILEDAQ